MYGRGGYPEILLHICLRRGICVNFRVVMDESEVLTLLVGVLSLHLILLAHCVKLPRLGTVDFPLIV